jgi:hypothetical protein
MSYDTGTGEVVYNDSYNKMYLAYQGLPRTFHNNNFNRSYWRPIYAIVTSVNPSLDYTDSCQTAYPVFRLDYCDGSGIVEFEPDPDNVCKNCLRVTNQVVVDFCDPNQGAPSCLVGMRNLGDVNGGWKENCYIEVFFAGIWDSIDFGDGSPPYKGGTVLASLRWSATGQYMTATGGRMLNCCNSSYF